jgi:hypothetical protein
MTLRPDRPPHEPTKNCFFIENQSFSVRIILTAGLAAKPTGWMRK